MYAKEFSANFVMSTVFRIFVDALHSVRIYEAYKSSNFRKQKCSSKFHKVHVFGSLYANRIFMGFFSVLRVTSEPRVKLAGRKSALTPPPPHPPHHHPGLFVVYSSRRFVVFLYVCHFVLVFFSPFSIAITSLGEERVNLSAFRTFVRFVLV